MEPKRVNKRTGRPLREFDKTIFEGLCHILCTGEEIETILRCNRDSLTKWCERTYKASFKEVYKGFCNGGKASLRRNQMRISKTSAAMCIWLGKQYLGQKDDHSGTDSFNGELKEFIDELKNHVSAKEEKRPTKKEISKHDPSGWIR